MSRREHSRFELGRKLAPHAESKEQVDVLLDELAKLKYLSEERFIASVLHRKSARYGNLRIKQELGQHQLDRTQVDEALRAVQDTEFDRAKAVWTRKFTSPPQNIQDRAKQFRFLAARGFSGGVISKVLGTRFDDDSSMTS